jgi:hypothetical protein
VAADTGTTVLAGLAIIGPLVGVWIGNRLQAGNQAARWRDDQRLSAYSEFVSAAVDQARIIDEMDKASSEEAKGLETQHAHIAMRYHNIVHLVRIVGSSQIRAIAEDETDALRDAEIKASVSSADLPSVDDLLLRASLARNRFSEQASQDLGFRRK